MKWERRTENRNIEQQEEGMHEDKGQSNLHVVLTPFVTGTPV